ncbi:MAG: heparinase II/III family protein [Planctomycetes bacterium]|nr:heparinase II/III family protein [Planctomycetota bacterium]
MPIPHPEAHITNMDNSLFSPLQTRQVPREHPRLLGPRSRLQALAKERPDAYRRTKAIAGRALTEPPHVADAKGDFGAQVSVYSKAASLALVCAIDEDRDAGRKAIDFIHEQYLNKPVPVGHVPFGADCGVCAIVYDFCHEHWTAEERTRYHTFLFACRDQNVDEELGPFHDGWWGYKNWGFILGLLAVMYETEKELFMLYGIDREFRTIAADSLRLGGDGGGFPEGFYVNYYLHEWLFACEALRHCTGADYLAEVPEFYSERAIASAFEQYPGIRERGSRRPICVGDGRGRFFKLERDGALTANRMLVAYHRGDPSHQAINTFLNQTPHPGADENAWRELLWYDQTVKQGNLKKFKLSHVSPGAGNVYARSSWEEDATYFFFKCGKRFTAHQHLDVGHFYIYKHEELAAKGGHYVDFCGSHDVNYYLRTIAHNSVLIHDPNEVFTYVRGFTGPTANDGGQAYPWPGTHFRHNGDCMDPDAWRRHPELGDIADLLAYQDAGSFMYTAGDCTRAYSPKKLEWFTRQIVFIRPGTFVIFDRVKSKDPTFKKTWLLHAGKPPSGEAPNFVVTNGQGRLHMQTILPAAAQVILNQGEDLYRYGGQDFPPRQKYGVEAECRIEVSPTVPSKVDYFLHVLTATESGVASVAHGAAKVGKDKVVLTIGKATVTFLTAKVGGSIVISGKRTTFAAKIER